MLQQLIQLGLSEEESELYLSMLELGGGFASQLAKKASRKRSSSYHTLNRLVEKGLATRVKKGSYQFFSPEPPETIVELTRRRCSTAEKLLPELQSIQNTMAKKPKIKFFERQSGIETIFEDTLTAEGEILGYTNLSLLAELFPGYFRRYTRERMKRGIKVRYLSPQPLRGHDLIEELFPEGPDAGLLEILFINPNQFPFQNEIAIYGDKVAIMSLSRKEQIAILIESKTVSSTMKAIFDLAWIGACGFIAS